MLKKIIATILIAAGLAFTAGCQNVALDGANNVGAFNYGEFQGLYNDVKAPAVADAAREAARQLGLVEVAFTKDKFGSTLIARDANDLKVQIKIAEANSRQTQLNVRWGPGGDRDKSVQLYNAIEKLLGGR